MVDIPGDSTTTSTLTVGGTVTDTLEIVGDHDWFRINLTAGQSITVTLTATGSGGLGDPYLRIRNAAGTQIFENDDGAGNLNSRISFQVTTTGTYYIDVGAFEDASTGGYQVAVSTFSPPPMGTPDQFADQLLTGYWGGASHRYSGSSVTVNVTDLTVSGQAVARQALTTWSEITGLRFVEVSSGGQMVFDDAEAGASTAGSWSGGLITSQRVNISTQWLTDYGTQVGSYAYQTYLHEIGHALGLGHAGQYNDSADYPYAAKFANDSWAISVMSYFDQRENTVTAGLGYTKAYLGTPMIADILAVQQLYGLSTTTRAGDTVYGFGSTAGNLAYDATAYPNIAYTIFDSGGIDTINYSNSSLVQRIDLNEGAYSNVNGLTGNVAVAFGTVIENAVGGSGFDTLIGNAANNVLTGGSGSDVLTGGLGADIFRDTLANLSGDTITDFARSDRINFTNATAGGFSASLSGNTLSFTGGSLTLTVVPSGRVVVSSAAAGVQVAILGATIANDFNGEGRSDILWRNDNGTFGSWFGSASGTFAINDGAALQSVATNWRIVGTDDFNGDGRDDILWRDETGQFGNWLANANGGFVFNAAAGLTGVSNTWHIVGTGDFNGDGRSDILWRDDAGAIGNWLANASGGFAYNAAAGVTAVSNSWNVAAIGDFNGDGRSDVLWRNDDGGFGTWLANAGGALAYNAAAGVTQVGNEWQIASTGDYNGDGRVDILWRNTNGQVGDWLANANGGFAYNAAAGIVNVAPAWHVQSPDIFWS